LGRNECYAITYTEFTKRKELNYTSRVLNAYCVTFKKEFTKK